MAATALRRLEPTAIAKGLVVFLVLTVFIPVLVIIVLSFGPSGWVTQYYYATRGFEPILFIFAGAVVSLVSRRAGILNPLVATTLGALITFILMAMVFAASPYIDAGRLTRHLLLPAAWSFVGIAGVALVRRARDAL